MICIMVAAALLSDIDALDAEQAAAWVSAALAEAQALRSVGGQPCYLSDDEAVLAPARRLHDAWKQWAAVAEEIVARVKHVRSHVGGLADLRYELSVAHLILERTPDELRDLYRQYQSGQLDTIGREEIRREVAERRREAERSGELAPR